MQYVVTQRKAGFVLTGEHGTGKTYLSRVLERICPPQRNKFVFVTDPFLSPEDFFQEVFLQLSAPSVSKPLSKPELQRVLRQKLIEVHSSGMHVVIVFDEVQAAGKSLLDEISMFLNVQSAEENYFTLILIGQRSLNDILEGYPQITQRFALSYVLSGLDMDETSLYVRHRLRVSGLDVPVFGDDVMPDVYRLSNGMPRVINNVCDLALLNGFLKEKRDIDAEVMEIVKAELNGTA